jgi:invasion protein IalB
MHVRFATALFAATLLLAGAAQAQSPSAIGTYSDWTAYSVSTGNGKICYALSQPETRKPEGLNRDPAYFFISTRPGEKVKEEVSVIMGFPLRASSEVVITVQSSSGSTNFEGYVKEDGAWIREAADERRLVEAMRKGRNIVVKGTSGRGNVTTDTYSLDGISAALDKAAGECK